MQILPPFATPVGRVGLSICFDVSLKISCLKPPDKCNEIDCAHILRSSVALPGD